MKEKLDIFTGKLATKLPPPFSAYYGEKKYMFVSYAHKDSEIVFPVLEMLHKKGVRLWYDEGLQAGQDWFKFMEQKILGCAGFLVFLGNFFFASPHAMKELEFAHDEKKGVIGISIDKTETPTRLDSIFDEKSGFKINVNYPELYDIVLDKIKKIDKEIIESS